MPTLTIEYQDANERLALEQALAYLAQLRQLALAAWRWRTASSASSTRSATGT
jgi:hypothetical protein